MSSKTPPDSEAILLRPAVDCRNPVLSIVVPAMNEEITISEFVEWCREGLLQAGVEGEILIVDSSSDSTAKLAVEAGARVLKVPKRGLGRAYIDALPFVRGRWIVMGDADCTYDFRQLKPFIFEFKNGKQFVMGSRWRGSIEKGAMPPHHQYFGTPVTTWILNRLYGSKFTDIHCGMRGIEREALVRMQLQSQSWEYASEMVLKSVHMGLETAEVPVHFLKDRDGRMSHHRRQGWFSPYKAAWINLRAMFVYGADFFALIPGLVLLFLGLVLAAPLTFGSFAIGPVTFSLYWHFLALIMASVGAVGLGVGAVARVLFDYTGRHRRIWLRLVSYNRTVGVAMVMFFGGVFLCVPLISEYLRNDLRLPAGRLAQSHWGVTGLLLIVLGSTSFVFTLLLHAAALASRFTPEEDS